MTPRVVMRSVGMTGSAMKLRVINGSISRLTPKAKAFSLASSSLRFTYTSGSSDMIPAMASGTSAVTAPLS